MTTSLDMSEQLGFLLGDAHARKGSQVDVPAELNAPDNAAAYRAQRAFLQRHRLGIGGWKIGAKSEDGPIQGAPLPQPGIHASPATLVRSDFPVFGVELEIMFRFGRDFLPDAAPVLDAEVLASIDGIGASIEIVSSRLAGWPDVPKPNQLADLQNHGALIVGEFVDYRDDVDFRSPPARLVLDGQVIFDGVGSNPAGDPRRLLPWLVRHCREQGIALPAGTVVTAGSYTGMVFPEKLGTVTGTIAGLPAVRLEVT
jgi:2-keto-4-pentenoate hydratase